MRKYFCGTPESFCSGAKTAFSTPWPIGASQKTHGSANQAFKCYASYLLGQGYKKVGSREFETPDGSILVLTKKVRFGASLRFGKEGNRVMGTQRHNGIIVSK